MYVVVTVAILPRRIESAGEEEGTAGRRNVIWLFGSEGGLMVG